MEAVFVHDKLDSRTRLKIEALKSQPAEMEILANFIRSLRGITKVETNPLTGSLLVHHRSDCRPRIITLLQFYEIFCLNLSSAKKQKTQKLRTEIGLLLIEFSIPFPYALLFPLFKPYLKKQLKNFQTETKPLP